MNNTVEHYFNFQVPGQYPTEVKIGSGYVSRKDGNSTCSWPISNASRSLLLHVFNMDWNYKVSSHTEGIN